MYKVSGGCVPIEYLVLGPIENNVYIIGDDESCFVVDPSCHADRILEAVGSREVKAIVITHAHWDHVGAAAQLREATGAPVIASAVDAPFITGNRVLPGHRRARPCPVDRTVSDGDVVEVGSDRWRVIATPGHTAGGICLFCDSPNPPAGVPVLVSGDTLFAGTHGRTDFPESDPAAMKTSLKKLAELPESTVVLPGHNGMTTIGAEIAWLARGTVGR